jgi:nuclear transport factor 2 (NTF2) superfamily protein
MKDLRAKASGIGGIQAEAVALPFSETSTCLQRVNLIHHREKIDPLLRYREDPDW